MNKSVITVSTRDFGEIDISSDNIISFPNGIFAFEEYKAFVLISPLGEDTYPMWLQSTEKAEPCFIVYNPFEITENYLPQLSDEVKMTIQYEEGDKVSYLTIAVVPDDFRKTTVNLKSPIVINSDKAIAVQMILDDQYQIKFPIFDDKGAV